MKTTPRWGHPYPELEGDSPDVPLWLEKLAVSLDAVAMDDQGPLTSRPASTPESPGKKGRYYFATDEGTLYRDTGTSWVPVNPVRVYPAKEIAAEEPRTANSFATLATPDEVSNVVVPKGARVLVSYHAHVRSGMASVDRVGLFVNGNLVKGTAGGPMEVAPAQTEPGYNIMVTSPTGLTSTGVATNTADDPATGQIMGSSPTELFLNAGTYTIGVRYKCSSGLLAAKERRLQVEVRGPGA